MFLTVLVEAKSGVYVVGFGDSLEDYGFSKVDFSYNILH